MRRLVVVHENGVETCASKEDLAPAVRANLGRDPFDDSAPSSVRVHFIKTTSGRLVDIAFADANGRIVGRKELRSNASDCAELGSSAALAIALAIDPLAGAPPAQDAKGPTPKAIVKPDAPVAQLAHEPPAAVSTPLAQRDPVHMRLGADVLGAFGSVPAATAGAILVVGGSWRSLSIDVEGRVDASQSQRTQAGAGVNASLLTGSLVPCYAKGVLRACALASFGVLRSSGEGTTTTLSADLFYASLGGRVGVEWPLLASFRLRAHASLAAPLTRRTLKIDGIDAWATPPLVGTIALGLVTDLW